MAIFGAFGVLWLRRVLLGVFLPPYLVQIESDVYSQIGLVMLIGLAAKNAILIVEFAKDEYEKGKPLADAALEGARLRLRPILMTSFAFILGCVPLWTATRRRVGGPPNHGHDGDRRDAGRQRDRNLLRACDLLPGGEVVRRGQGAGPHRVARQRLRRRRETEMVHCRMDKRGRDAEMVMKKMASLMSAILAAIGFDLDGGCMVGPNYHRPVVQTPGAYRDLSENPQAQAQVASFADLPWWQVFQDPQLQELIRTALKENYDLQLATERITPGARSGHHHALQSVSAGARATAISAAERTQTPNRSPTFWLDC